MRRAGSEVLGRIDRREGYVLSEDNVVVRTLLNVLDPSAEQLDAIQREERMPSCVKFYRTLPDRFIDVGSRWCPKYGAIPACHNLRDRGVAFHGVRITFWSSQKGRQVGVRNPDGQKEA
ncbi:hypothetical protein GCT13_21460 [Paraburkholderia sp. CNPSo 3157]|uniref:Uncharacterized protein n=1 Tax=Paraburkholderia franconis TaxID=2654983 RepID=A0A7X1THC2_9BURK|nr:hypothetical protein [Paraburkholderia franconis]MPW19395.1 hypothetical protein [Paraburkholderia franconis]